MADVRDIVLNLIGRETVSGAAKKAADGVDRLGDEMKATARDAESLDREIEQAEKALADLATQFARTSDAAQRVDLTKAMRQQQTEVRRLVRSRDIVQEAVKGGAEAGTGFGVAMVARIGPILARAPLGPVGAAIGGLLATAMVPALGAAVAGAVLGGVGAGGVVGGIALAAKDSRVQAAGKALGESVMGDLEDSASRFVNPTIRGIGIISDAWDNVADDIDGALASASRYVEPLARGVAGVARELGPALRRGVEAAGPVIREISDGLPRIGAALGDLMGVFADNADAGASGVRLIVMGLEQGVHFAGGMISLFADMYRALLDVNEAAIATAETLMGWNPIASGFIDSQKKKLGELRAAMEEGGEAGWVAGDRAAGGIRKVGDAATAATPPVQTLGQFLSESIGRAFESEEAADRQAEAFLRLGQAAKDGAGKGIDRSSEAGIRNRRALREAAEAANANAAQILKTTGNHELAAKVTEDARAQFLAAAKAMGVEKGEAINLANKLFGIPKEVKTDVKANTGTAKSQVIAYDKWLASVNLDKTSTVYQRFVAESRTARGGVREFSRGGYVDGPGPRGVDSVPALLAPGEGVLDTDDMNALGGRAGLARLRATLKSGGRAAPIPGAVAGGLSAGVRVVEHRHVIVLEGRGVLNGLREEIRILGGDVQVALGS